ncbi:MAG: LLM class flavin-dependent oxidoreductase [Streptosporangiaceae bacterium]|jgi:alkanesulfonate monooxygenase SsuD/methylene tetrahydromethanopterin reductase-like flavin-dependent oxidoreductase (luciferase family)
MSDHGLTIGIKASQQHASIGDLRRLWHTADEAGFDSCWAFDHLVPMGRVREGDIFEGWTILAAMAEATRRIRIGTLVTSNLYRHPGLLAKMAVTVDHLSGGRLTMGLGAGGDAYADAMFGLPLPTARERVGRLGEACDVLTRLWTEQTVTFRGTYYTLEEAHSDPKPLQKPRLPLWIASNGPRYGLRVVAAHADVWLNASLTPEDLGDLVRLSRRLDEHCADVGRDPATIRRAVQFRVPDRADEILRAAERYARAGFSDLILMPYQGGADRVEELAGLLPALRALGETPS